LIDYSTAPAAMLLGLFFFAVQSIQQKQQKNKKISEEKSLTFFLIL
jgi:preprotein translocase subunit YajC